jgi:hypothetical protein
MNTLNPGGRLGVNHQLRSNNGLYVLIMQGDGNLVLYEGVMTPPRRAVWSTNTWNLPPERRPNRADMQQDGNFVLYSTTGAEWASGTHTFPGSRLILQDDRNLVIYDPNNIARWSSNSKHVDLGDGALLRDQDKPAVWVMCGGARFLVPSEAELLAMGYNWAQVQVVPPGTVAPIPTIPRDGTIFKERTPGEVYVVYSGRKYQVPNGANGDAFACMGLDRTRLRTLPNGSAASVPTVAFYSPEPYEVEPTPGSLTGVGKTPGSLVFPPRGPEVGDHFARSDIATTVKLVSQGREVRLIELRGWLRKVETGFNPEGDGADWHYDLEVDTSWAASRGIDLGRFFKVGDILEFGDFGPTNSYQWATSAPRTVMDNPFKMAVAVPRIHIELNSWKYRNRYPPSGKKPEDWVWSMDDKVFPFNPLQPPGFPNPLGEGQYVRVVGSLVTDSAHVATDWGGHFWSVLLPPEWITDAGEKKRAAGAAWSSMVYPTPGLTEEDKNPAQPARWNEIHPPDLFQPLREPSAHQRETVRGVALLADGGHDIVKRTVWFTLRPPDLALKPSSSARLSVLEHVGPETNLKSIVEGNASKTGARIDVLTDRVRVRIGVAAGGGWGFGKFKGIYRVSWDAMGSPTDQPARYGRNFKAVHWNTGRTLHSHPLNYSHPNSSKQQQITCFEGLDDNDWWRIKGPHGLPENHKADQPVLHGDVVRLEHVLTRRNLHSHGGIPSPITKQQEVTCFGNNGIGDGNDNWRVEVEGGDQWAYGKRVRLIHVSTNHALHSHEPFTHPTYTAGQQEVTGFSARDDNDWWYLFEGGVVGAPIRAKHSGKVLDVEGVSTANGAKIQQWDYLGGDNQKWRLESVGGGYYRIVAQHSGKVLDVAGISTANGARIQQWDWLGGDNQKWKLEALDDGHYKIVAKHSGKVLDVEGISTANGAKIQQWDWLGGNNQRWTL